MYTYHIHFLAENKSTHIPASILLPLCLTHFWSKIKRGFQSTYISHMLGWIDIHAQEERGGSQRGGDYGGNVDIKSEHLTFKRKDFIVFFCLFVLLKCREQQKTEDFSDPTS